MRQKKRKKRGEEKGERYFAFCASPNLIASKYFGSAVRRPRSERPANGFVVSFSSLQQDSDQETARLALKLFNFCFC